MKRNKKAEKMIGNSKKDKPYKINEEKLTNIIECQRAHINM